MKEFKSFVTDICFVTAFLFVSLFATTNVANAHCDGVKHGPGHRHCDGGTSPPPPPPDPPGNPAFAYVLGSGGPLRVMDVDGSNNTSVFDKHVSRNLGARDVRWSPSGNQIVYRERYNPPAGLYVTDSDGGNRTEISPYDSNGVRLWVSYAALEWRDVDVSDIAGVSGPLNRIFFIGAPEGNNSGHSAYWDLYTIDPDAPTPITAHNITQFDQTVRIEGGTVSPDGRRVALRQRPPENAYSDAELWIYDVTPINGELTLGPAYEKTPTAPPSGQFAPGSMRWANQSDKVIYSENDLFVLDFSGTPVVTRLSGGNSAVQLGCEQGPVWSPDDQHIAFGVQCVNQQVEGIYVGELDDSSQTLTLINYQRILKSTTPTNVDWRRTWQPTP